MKLNSIRFKISVLYIAILGVILIIYSGFLYLTLRYTLYDELDDELHKKAGEIAAAIRSYIDAIGYDRTSFNFALQRVITFGGEHPEQYKINEFERQWLQKVDKLDLREDYINFLNVSGKPLVSSSNLQIEMPALSSKELTELQKGNSVFRNIKLDKRNIRIIGVPFLYGDNEQYIIQVGTSLKLIIHLLEIRLMHIAVSIPFVLLFASFLGRIFTSRILRPVVEITKTASKITHEDLSARVWAEHIDEEMRYLVDAFNDMISRLEKSFKYIAEFSSHVSHELKTPLAIMRGESEIALKKERDPEEYRRVIKINLEEAQRMLKIVEDLLLLTRMDYQPEVFKFEKLDLTQFLKEIYEQTKILASERAIAVTVDMPQEPKIINADKLHLRRLFLNLIDNAIKFTPQNGRIEINAKCEDKKVMVSISDTGIGIKEKHLSEIFNKFFRAVKGTPTGTPGSGLGLSIAQSIVKFHNGNITVKSQPGEGSTFTVTLPLL